MTTVGFTRPADRLEAGMEACKDLGLSCICAPSLDPVPGTDKTFEKIRNILSGRSAYFTVFASVTAVKTCVDKFGKQTLYDLLMYTNVACTGPTTAEYLEKEIGRACDLIPETYSGEGVAEELSDEVGDKLVLLLRSDSGDSRIVSILEEAGAYVVDVAVYSMVPAAVGESHIRLMEGVTDGTVNAMVFSSPMTFKTFYDQMKERYGTDNADACLSELFTVAIGKPTADAMEMLGHAPDAVPEKSTFDAMLHIVKKYLNE